MQRWMMVISIAVVIVRPYNQGLQPKARKHKTIVFITEGLEGNSWGLLRLTPREPNQPPTVSALLWPLRSGGTFLNILLCLSRNSSWWSVVWTHLTVHCTVPLSTLRGSIPGCSFSDWQQWGGSRGDRGALGELRHDTQPQLRWTTSCQGQHPPLPSPPVLSF